MPSTYTPEQIEQAKEWLKEAAIWGGWPTAQVILAALEAAEQERDALAAYAAKLEKAGDAMRNKWYLVYEPEGIDWDAARKEKP